MSCVRRSTAEIDITKFSQKGKIFTNAGHVINHFKQYIITGRDGTILNSHLAVYMEATEVVEFEYIEKRKVGSELVMHGYFKWWKKICQWGKEGKSLFNMRHKDKDIVFLTNEWYKEHLKSKNK